MWEGLSVSLGFWVRVGLGFRVRVRVEGDDEKRSVWAREKKR